MTGMHAYGVRGHTRLHAKGTYTLELTREGEIVYTEKVDNLLTLAFEDLVSKRMFYSGGIPAAPQYLAFGSGGLAATKSQTALVAEFGVARFTPTLGTSFALNGILQLTYTVVPVALMAGVAEVGMFNAAAVGTMCSRAVVNPFTMGPPDTLAVGWTVQFLGVD